MLEKEKTGNLVKLKEHEVALREKHQDQLHRVMRDAINNKDQWKN